MKNITRWVVVSSFMLCTSMMMDAYANPGGKRFSQEDVRAARGGKQGGPSQGQGRTNEGARNAQNKSSGKMSPDERRALRRQINDAGQDIYRR